MYAHINELRIFAFEFKPKILLLSETRTVENMTDAELDIEGYNIFRCDSHNRHTGGVAVYIRKSISAFAVNSSKCNFVWSLSIKISKGFLNDVFSVIYRGHDSHIRFLESRLEEICDDAVERSSGIHILGDFNVNFTNKPQSKSIVSVARLFGLHQKIASPTRVTSNTSTLIDWYLTNSNELAVNVYDNFNISDHNFVAVNLFAQKKVNSPNPIVRTVLENYSKDSLLA